MHYPDKLIEIQDGLTLYIPDPERVKCTYEELLGQDQSTPFPFWAKIWPSAIALTSFLQREPDWIKNKTVLELGAGIGLPSFVMAHYAKTMIISDHAVEAVALMNKNIQHLQLNHTKAICLDWNHFPDDVTAETILLSDINYAPDQFEPLLQLIRKFIDKGSVIILSTPQRINITPFAESLQPYIKRSVLKTEKYGNEVADIRLLILSN